MRLIYKKKKGIFIQETLPGEHENDEGNNEDYYLRDDSDEGDNNILVYDVDDSQNG